MANLNEMKNQEVYILFSCNQWHEHDSKRLVACFTDTNNVLDYVFKFLSSDDAKNLIDNGQTQGRETNYILNTEKLNPEYH